MNRNTKSNFVAMVAAIVLLGGILFLLIASPDFLPWSGNNPGNLPDPGDDPAADPGGETPDDPTPIDDPSDDPGNVSPDDPAPVYTYPAEVEPFLPAILTPCVTVLANKQNSMPEDFVPEGLIDLPSSLIIGHPEGIKLNETVATALEAMMFCMRADGITDTYVTSGYRSYARQNTIFRQYIREEQEKNPKLCQAEAQEIVLTYSAAPGTSEHQTGLCVDLMTNTMTALDASFERTKAFAWLSENACRFGFILRYPKDKTDITGYAYEPWHYRFVGRDAAAVIWKNGWTFEEYLANTGSES